MALSVSFNSLEEVQVGIYNSRDVVEAEDSEFFFLSLSNDILRNIVNHNLLVLVLAVYVLEDDIYKILYLLIVELSLKFGRDVASHIINLFNVASYSRHNFVQSV